MSIVNKLRNYAARRALEQKLRAEMATLSDAELNDLNLSYAKALDVAHAQAFAS